MRIYQSHASLPGLGATDQLEVAVADGFDGLAVSDRDPQIWDSSARDQLVAQAPRSFGFVVDANADLTLADRRDLELQILRLERLLRICERISARVMRLAIGGQKLGLRKFLGTGGSKASEPTSPGTWRWLLGSRPVVRLGHWFRARQLGRPFTDRVALEIASQSLASLAPKAAAAGVHLAVENHWGVTAWPSDLVEIVSGADSDQVGTCPDFENFPHGVDRYRGLERLAPFALLVHARSRRFRSTGEERDIDYSRCLGILRRAGFRGALCVEFLGSGDPRVGARLTRALILRHLESQREV